MAPSKDKLNIYLTILVGALRGGDKGNADILLSEYKEVFLECSKWVQREIKYVEVDKLYRGVLLNPDSVPDDMLLKPLSHIKYISFSEDLEVAKEFADTKSFISGYFMQVNPNSKGYLIEYKPEPEEILFHWQWLKYSPFLRSVAEQFLDLELIEHQKEVILFQTNKIFNLRESI